MVAARTHLTAGRRGEGDGTCPCVSVRVRVSAPARAAIVNWSDSDKYLLGILALGASSLVVFLVALAAEWVDRRTDAPIMHQRVNDGSNEYLWWQRPIWRSALDTVLRSLRQGL